MDACTPALHKSGQNENTFFSTNVSCAMLSDSVSFQGFHCGCFIGRVTGILTFTCSFSWFDEVDLPTNANTAESHKNDIAQRCNLNMIKRATLIPIRMIYLNVGRMHPGWHRPVGA